MKYSPFACRRSLGILRLAALALLVVSSTACGQPPSSVVKQFEQGADVDWVVHPVMSPADRWSPTVGWEHQVIRGPNLHSRHAMDPAASSGGAWDQGHVGVRHAPFGSPGLHGHIAAQWQPSRPTIPGASGRGVWKTPFSYGYFGAQGKKHWSKQHGYRDRATRWTLR